MAKQPKYFWDEDNGIARCILYYKDMKFLGLAFTSEEDKEYKSERVGCEIAYRRALIDYLVWIKKNEIKPQIKMVENILSELKQSYKFNPKSYETIHLFRKLRGLEYDLATIKQMITTEKKELEIYINENDKRNHKK